MPQVTLAYTDEGGDCWVDQFGNFDSADVFLWIGSNDALGWDMRTWFPFTVQLNKNTQIVSATLKIIATVLSQAGTSTINVACEAANSVVDPANGADLQGRSKTTGLDLSLGQYTNGGTFSYDCTAAVQAILNRAGWVKGNRLAVIMENVDTAFNNHKCYSYNNGSNRPTLEIVVNTIVPRSSGLFL